MFSPGKTKYFINCIEKNKTLTVIDYLVLFRIETLVTWLLCRDKFYYDNAINRENSKKNLKYYIGLIQCQIL
jgi:hypothetical protein